MKEGWSWIIVLILFFSLLFYFTGFANASSDCPSDETICFQNETIEKQIGSYQMMDSNGRIIQSGHWKNSIDLFFNPECVYPQLETKTTFYSDWNKNWHWNAKTNLFGDVCYKLSKN